MEQNKNSESPGSPPPSASPQSSGFFFKDGREIPRTHPDHGPMHLLPRQEDGRFAAYYYCSKAELHDMELREPPPRRQRRDGFCAKRQEEFLEQIRGGASGREAARRIGISPTTAYNLYNSPDGAAFRQAWDEAARVVDIVLEDTAFDRAVNGQEEIVYHRGQRVGVRWKYDNRLLMQMLRARNPLKYAPLSEIEGWLKRRGIAPTPDVDGALDRLRAAEAEWGRRLPGEEAAPRIGNEAAAARGALPSSVQPEPVDASPERLPQAGGPATACASALPGEEGPSTGPGRTEVAIEKASDPSTSSISSGFGQAGEVATQSTSSTSSGFEQAGDIAAQSTSSTSGPPWAQEDPSSRSVSSTFPAGDESPRAAAGGQPTPPSPPGSAEERIPGRSAGPR